MAPNSLANLRPFQPGHSGNPTGGNCLVREKEYFKRLCQVLDLLDDMKDPAKPEELQEHVYQLIKAGAVNAMRRESKLGGRIVLTMLRAAL